MTKEAIVGTSRYEIDRQSKLSEILDEAHAQLASGGYEGLSTSGIARALGVRPNTVSWYYPSKDELLVGVVKREWEGAAGPALAQILSAKPDAGMPLEAIRAGLDLIYARRYLAIAIHQRLDHSPLVQEFHDSLYAAGRQVGPTLLNGIVRTEDHEVVTSIILTLIEGQLLHEMTDEQRHGQITAVLDAFAAQEQLVRQP